MDGGLLTQTQKIVNPQNIKGFEEQEYIWIQDSSSLHMSKNFDNA